MDGRSRPQNQRGRGWGSQGRGRGSQGRGRGSQGRGRGSQRQNYQPVNSRLPDINNDDAGIFVTCDRGQEAKCIREMEDVLSEYITSLPKGASESSPPATAIEGHDIETDIAKELESIKASATDPKKSFAFVKLEISCVTFIRIAPELDPVSIVRNLCESAADPDIPQRTRFVHRLTPVVCMRKILGDGLEFLCSKILIPVFGEGSEGKKFAIRPTVRNNDALNRDKVIQVVAEAVGALKPAHSVDLKNFDRLILVEVFRNVVGMSVVGPEFEHLKRFNLSELYPKPDEKPAKAETEGSTKQDIQQDSKDEPVNKDS